MTSKERVIFKEPEAYHQRPVVRRPIAGLLNVLNHSGILTRQFEVTGMENIGQLTTPAIVAPNHRSMADTVLDGLIVGKASERDVWFAGKQELWKHRPLGWLFESLGSFPVKRSGGGVDHFTRVCTYMLEHGTNVVVYPQGTRHLTDTITETKKGAALMAVKNNVPIVPMGQYGTEDLYNPRKRLPVTVIIGEAISHDPEILLEAYDNGLSERKALIEAARDLDLRMQTAMQVVLDQAHERYEELL